MAARSKTSLTPPASHIHNPIKNYSPPFLPPSPRSYRKPPSYYACVYIYIERKYFKPCSPLSPPHSPPCGRVFFPIELWFHNIYAFFPPFSVFFVITASGNAHKLARLEVVRPRREFWVHGFQGCGVHADVQGPVAITPRGKHRQYAIVFLTYPYDFLSSPPRVHANISEKVCFSNGPKLRGAVITAR